MIKLEKYMSDKRKVEDILSELGKKIDDLIEETRKAGSRISEDMEDQISKFKAQKEKLENELKNRKLNEKCKQARYHGKDVIKAMIKALSVFFK